MIYYRTPISGVHLIDLEKRGDERGFFARVICEKEFAAQGLDGNVVQVNNSLSSRAGTLRGMHYQLPPAAEVKIVRCVRGALYDVVVDLRPDSPTFKQWHGAKLTADNRSMMYVPRGCAHGFLTLVPDSEVVYFVTAAYDPERERGVRWNDREIGIEWPAAPVEMSARDRELPDLSVDFHGLDQLRGLA
jgi:dTDP-4-dehydrorhamnose 3,5-epimerase